MTSNPDTLRNEVAQNLHSLKTFPKIVLDILDVLDDEDANANLLVDLLHRDPVLSGKLLGLANILSGKPSSGRPITDVMTSVSMLGFSRIRTLVSTLSLRNAFCPVMPTLMANQFWEHSVDVATAAKVIAEHCGLKSDLSYVAGLIHDIGILWIAINYPTEYAHLCAPEDDTTHNVIESERQWIGTDHAEVGAILCELWGLPDEIRQSVAGHHNPDQMPPCKYVMSVHFAEVACNALNLGQRPRNGVSYFSEQTLPLLGLDWTQIPDLLGEIDARARFMRTFTGVSSGRTDR